MTIILETGIGVQKANSYILPAFVTAYLTQLGRETEGGWSTAVASLQEAAVIAATNYLDIRWGSRLKATRLNAFVGVQSRAIVTVSGQPTDADTITVGATEYTFAAVLDDYFSDQILIGADADETIENIIAALVGKQEISAALRTDTTDQILLTALIAGESGDNTPLETPAANIDVTNVFAFGEDAGSQALEFPRAGLVDRSGRRVYGLPRRVMEATAEYAVRAVAGALLVDPTTDATGRIVQEKQEKVGPLEEKTVYAEGAALEQLLKPYPAADRMLADYITSAGVIR